MRYTVKFKTEGELKMRKNWKIKKAKIVALGIANNALVVLAHALNIALWLYIMYECLLGGWGD